MVGKMIVIFLAQIIGAVAWLFFLISYYSKNLNKVIFMQIISSILYCINYGLLGAWVGLFISAFELLKEIGYYKTDKDKYIFYFTIPVYILIAFISERGLLLIVPIVASVLDGYGALKSRNMMVMTGTISNALWICYDLYYRNYVVAFTDAILVISNLFILIYGYSKYLRRNKVYTVAEKDITKDIMEKLYNLDKKYYDTNYIWDLDRMMQIYNSENNSYILIKDQNEVIGYINILNVKPNIYEKMDNSNELYDSFNSQDIIRFRREKEYYLSINSIVLKNEYQNNNSVDKIICAIKKFIKEKNNKGYKIAKINCFAVNEFEKKILEKLKFNKIKSISNEELLYEIVY